MLFLLTRTAFLLLTEISLTLVQLDDLADYSEYLFKVKETVSGQSQTLVQYECSQTGSKLTCRPLQPLALALAASKQAIALTHATECSYAAV
ncbi:MAG: hypothetical protein F6J97_07265 [Leptolyngbya sp. SIO4C1]|nr:hypothetical protein [Leptolyngbya sp. SIO4C1]